GPSARRPQMLHEPQINGVFCCHDATDRGSVGADAGRLFPPFPLGSCGQCCSAATVARNLRNLGRLPENGALLCEHGALTRAEQGATLRERYRLRGAATAIAAAAIACARR